MIRRSLPVAGFSGALPGRVRNLALVCGLSFAGVVSGCSVSWHAGASKGSSTQSSGSEAAAPAHHHQHAPSGRDNVERVTVTTRPTATPVPTHVAAPTDPSAKPEKPARGRVVSGTESRPDPRPEVPASAAASGESGSPVPTPESSSAVAPPVTAPVDTSAGQPPVIKNPAVKTADKVETEPHYAPQSKRKPTKRGHETVEPKQNRNRVESETTPAETKTDRTR